MAGSSAAVFLGRLQELGLGAYAGTFKDKGWDTYNTFAFAGGSHTGSPDDAAFDLNIVIPLLADLDSPLKAVLRYLYFESFTVVATEMKRRVACTDEGEALQKMPILERNVRLEAVKKELSPGIKVDGEYEPSHALVDKLMAMQVAGVLKALPWSALGRRDLEVRGAKSERYWKADGAGAIREQSRIVEIEADVGSDLRLKIALQRRGIAMQMAKLLSFKVHDLWVSKLFREYGREPISGYEKVGLEQLRLADEELFSEMSELSGGMLTQTIMSELPLDAVLPRVMCDPRVSSLLVPLPARSRAAPALTKIDEQDKKRQRLEKEKAKRERKWEKKGGKGSGKDKDNEKDGAVPKELRGLMSTWKGKRLCYAFNLEGCKHILKDGACEKGLHACAKCGGHHSQRDGKCPPRSSGY